LLFIYYHIVMEDILKKIYKTLNTIVWILTVIVIILAYPYF